MVIGDTPRILGVVSLLCDSIRCVVLFGCHVAGLLCLRSVVSRASQSVSIRRRVHDAQRNTISGCDHAGLESSTLLPNMLAKQKIVW